MVARVTTTAKKISSVEKSLVIQYAKSLVGKSHGPTAAKTLILAAQPIWDGPDTLTLPSTNGEAVVGIRPCVSTLAVREAMRERNDEQYLVVLTDRSDSDLGLGILSRCYDQRVVTPTMWEAVKGAFHAKQIDGRLSNLPWMAEALVANTPNGGWPPAPAGELTRDLALRSLTSAITGLDASNLDPSSILAWTLDGNTSARLREQPPAVRNGIIDWIREAVGPVASLTVSIATQDHSLDAVSIGLTADVLWTDDLPSADVIAARTRLEHWTGVHNLDAQTARAFADAARGVIQRMESTRDQRYPGVLDRATALFTDLRYDEGAAHSQVLAAGYEARLVALAEQVRTAVSGGAPGLPAMESAFADLLSHDKAGTDRATTMARMAVRLTRWLAFAEGPQPSTLDQAVLRQAREGAYVDWAAADVWVGSTTPELAVAWSELFSAVRRRRDTHDARFAELLADATSRGVLPDQLVPVESVISAVLQPVTSSENRALLIVIDGMSTAVAAELTEQALRTGWFEAVPAADQARTATLAVLPTLTRYSRTSLFTGSLADGSQAKEKSGFAALTGGQLFHKADLIGGAGQALPENLLEAIRSTTPMTAVVLNTVDDALSKADPGGTDWTLEGIQHLAPLLEEARRVGRFVILMSDHGHVVERGGTPQPIEGAEARWRSPATGPMDAQREVALSGPRVLANGGSIIAAVDEGLRYAIKQAGYHGGASAAEAVIPIVVLSCAPDELESAGWVPAAPQAPAWWNDPVSLEVQAAQPVKRSSKPAPKGQEMLDIEIPETEPAGPSAGQSLTESLLVSPIYRAQSARYGARAIPDEIVQGVILVLVEHAGRVHRDTLASAAGIPANRLHTTLPALKRQLNVEGYDVLATDVDGVTVILDVDLLRQQFLEDSAV